MLVVTKKLGKINLTDQNYIASGGQAKIYKKDKFVYKIYHDYNDVIPKKKIQELSQLSDKRIIKPLDMVYDQSGQLIGYIMQYINNSVPICKLFTKTFRNNNSIEPTDIVELVKQMQDVVFNIHQQNFLIVDLNEMNLLTDNKFKIPLFIDVDSYQTPSFKATAIMDSIRDRLVKGNNFTIYSDWFSFAVVTFQLFIGCHPFKGSHPNYKRNEWSKRMNDGISVLDTKSKMPPSCYPISAIPDKYLSWYRDIFVNNNRDIPPNLDSSEKIVIDTIKKSIISGTSLFDIQKLYQIPKYRIIKELDVFGNSAYLLNDGYYYNNASYHDPSINSYYLSKSDNSNLIIGSYKNGKLSFQVHEKTNSLQVIDCDQVMMRNDLLYTCYNKKLMEWEFKTYNNTIRPVSRLVCSVSDLSTTFFDGVIYQDLLGTPWLTIPYEKGKVTTLKFDELTNYRIIQAKSIKNIVMVIGEKNGQYDKFIFIMAKDYSAYDCRIIQDIDNMILNFTVIPNGACIHISDDNEMEIFTSHNNIKVIQNSPLELNMMIYTISNQVRFIDNSTIYNISMKNK